MGTAVLFDLTYCYASLPCLRDRSPTAMDCDSIYQFGQFSHSDDRVLRIVNTEVRTAVPISVTITVIRCKQKYKRCTNENNSRS